MTVDAETPTTSLVALFKNHAMQERGQDRSRQAARSSTTSRWSRSASPARADCQRVSRRRRSRTGRPTRTPASRSTVTYAERFARQYQQFKAQAAQTKSGTPLEYAPFLTEARRAELRALNIYTVEALAAIDGAGAEEPRPRRPRAEERGDGVHRARAKQRRAEHAAAGRAGGAARDATRCSRRTSQALKARARSVGGRRRSSTT